MDHIVLVPNNVGTSRGVALFGGKGTVAPRRSGVAVPHATITSKSLGRAMHLNDTWVEVMRMHEKAVNPTMPEVEGTHQFGCWFFPASGSGVWLNTRRSHHLLHKAEAAGQPPFVENGPGDFLAQWLGSTLGFSEEAKARRWPAREWQFNWSTQFRDGLWRPYLPSRWPTMHGGDTTAWKLALDAITFPPSHRSERFTALAPTLHLDTVQVQSTAPSDDQALPSEVVDVSRGCMSGSPIGACPPTSLELRGGVGASFGCRCEEGEVALNCRRSTPMPVGGGRRSGVSKDHRVSFRKAVGVPENGFDSCAVVGSSGALLTERFGNEIDAHELVVRFNLAPQESFEPLVGSKTTLRFLNTQAMGEVLQTCAPTGECKPNPSCCPRVRVVILNSNSKTVTSCYQSVCGGGISRHATHLDESPFVLRATAKKHNVMSGTYGIAAALLLCTGRVTVFGFTTTAGVRAPYHYYDRCGPDTKADSLAETAASIRTIVSDDSRITVRASAGSHPQFRVAAAGDCPDAREANSRITRGLQNRELLVPSIDVAKAGLPPAASVARRLRVSTSPYVVMHGYWNRSMARALRAEVVQSLQDCSETGEGMDRRRLGASAGYPLSLRFQEDAYLLQIARLHHPGKAVNVRAQAGLTLAGERSGGGWHKDTLSRGIKALLYLDDVDASNGPFSMLLDYDDHKLAWIPDAVSGIRRRLNESAIARACAAPGRSHVAELHARMGSVVVFEISSAHCGKPCASGERASITNYYKVSKKPTACQAGQHVTVGHFTRSASGR